MNDFLTRLAQRSIGAAPLIMPRLPGLFAPIEESRIGNLAVTSTATDAVTDSSRNSTPASPPLPSRTAGHADSTPSEPHAFVYPAQRTATPEAVNAPAAQIATTPASVESLFIPLVETAQANSQATPPLVAPSIPHTGASVEPSIALRKQDTPAAAAEQWLTLLPQRKADAIATFSALADTPLRADTGTPPAPTVHITIGRVEVRANVASPQAAPRPRPASQPAISLGDYLKRGAGT